MTWVILSILAALFWSVVNMVDKYVVTKWFKQPLVPVIMLGIFGLIASLLVYFISGFAFLSCSNIILALLAGIFYVLMSVFYFKALKIEEVSRIIPLFHLSPFFILVLATIFLGEVFTPIKYLGIFLLVIGAILVSSKNRLKLSFGKAFGWMMLSVTSSSISSILTKYLLDFADYWTIFAYLRIGAAIGAIPIAYIYFPELINTVRRHGKKVVTILSANEILNLFAVLFITIATSIGYVTLVHTLSSIQPFFVLVFAVILSIFYPSILKEEIGKSVILLKILAIILMFIGVVLIT